MIALLSIGDELLTGEIVDTNAAWLSARLYEAGLPVTRQLTVGDDPEAIVSALTELAARHRAVIVTGGLGPTSDDVTAKAAAKACGRRLAVNEEALEHLQSFAGRLGGNLHPLNQKQALLPERATLIPNPVGTACGFSLPLGGCPLFFLPGVPDEMTAMVRATVLPHLAEQFPDRQTLATRELTVFGISEAEVSGRLAELELPDGVGVAYCVSFPSIQVKLRGSGRATGELTDSLDRAEALVRGRLAGFVVAEGGATIDQVVATRFREQGLTVALAESCTGGLVAKRLTDMAGSSAYFLQGVVTYANSAKERLLGVPATLLAEKGAVSREVAMAMARGVRQLAGSDLGLAITGIAGPDGGTTEKPVGTVFLALADGRGCHVKGYRFAGDREHVRTISAYTALDWLRRRLEES